MKVKRTDWDKEARVRVGVFLTAFLAVFFYLGISLANPDTVAFKSALVWRQDAAGDYIFGAVVGPGTYEVSPAYTTEGQIETISASWEFTGEVTLEVSADGGMHYTPIVNGGTLSGNFVKGNYLKWRATLANDSELTEVKISYTDILGVLGTFGNPRLSGFGLRKALYITNSSSRELFNYQIKIEVAESSGATDYDIHCEGEILAGFADIRFTGADGQTIFPHYLEKTEGTSPNRVATFWVQVPQIPAEGLTLYLYYGNSGAANISSGDEVFEFFDDFSGADLNQDKWELKEGDYSISDAKIGLESAEIVSRDYQIKDGIIEYRAQPDIGDEVRVILRAEPDDVFAGANQIAYSSTYAGAEHCLAVGDIVKANKQEAIDAATTYDYRAVLSDTNITFQRYDQGFDELQAETSYDDTGGLTTGRIGLKAGTGCTSYFDWVRVRKYSSAIIEVNRELSQAQEAEEIQLPTFSNLELNQKDNLVLAQAKAQGSYTSPTIALVDAARILVPSMQKADTQQGTIELDISLDGGENYIYDLEQEKYYYASNDDFSAGDELQFKLGFQGKDATSSAQLSEIKIDYGLGKILLISPNGGETYTPGTEQEITWTAQEYEESYEMKLEYSLNNGQTYQAITAATENDGTYLWTVPGPSVVAQFIEPKAVVKISDAQESEIFDVSDDVFSISGQAEPESESVTEQEVEEEIIEEEIDLEKLLEEGERPSTQLYDVVIKLNERRHPDPEEDAQGRFKYGDILLVKPAGHIWSETERKSYLIIQVYLTEKETRELTRPKTIATVDESGQPTEKIVKARAKRLDLNKLGLGKEMLNQPEKEQKLHTIRNLFQDKALPEDVIEEK